MENLSSTNPGGTTLNGAPVVGKVALKFGDELSICGKKFQFQFGARGRPSLPAPPPLCAQRSRG